MIAVFSRDQSMFKQELDASPCKEFMRIRDYRDIAGRSFTGVILMYHWYDNKDLIEAYDILRERQPELFKK